MQEENRKKIDARIRAHLASAESDGRSVLDEETNCLIRLRHGHQLSQDQRDWLTQKAAFPPSGTSGVITLHRTTIRAILELADQEWIASIEASRGLNME